MCWRTLLPPASSILPQSKILSDRPRRIAFDLDQVLDRVRPVLVVGQEHELGLGLGELDGHALEVEPRPDLATNLVERVAQLLFVEVADDVE